MLYLFDLDGTLITSYMDRPDKDYHAWGMLPGRTERLAQLRERGNQIGIVTNQGGVAWGHNTEADFERKITRVAREFGYSNVTCISYAQRNPPLLAGLPVWACYADSRAPDARYHVNAHRRKPSGAMILEAMQAFGRSVDETLYVGDRQEDSDAAQDAVVRFQWAHIFFKD